MSEYKVVSERNLTFRDYLNQTFVVMGLGLLISALSAFISNFILGIIPVYSLGIILMICMISELGVAILFGARLYKMSKKTAWICYVLYCILTGITLSFILSAYTLGSASFAFMSTVVLFACMAIIGHTTKVDLSKIGPLLSVGLLSVIIISIINVLFIRSELLSIGICYMGIFIFLGLIAYDVRKLRDLYNQSLHDSELSGKLMIYGAFQLYLDFINLFLRLLQIFGKRRD